MTKFYLVSTDARRAHRASKAHWLELDYLRVVLKDCAQYYSDLREYLRESASEAEEDMLWEDYRSDIRMILWRAEMRGCSNASLSQISSWLLQ